ncbi:MAG: xanthine dehydrogenase family protein subunit M [Alphaproteobacteria bacterium]|nr:xanthine dehydrogenase family protein subunit M [Alphaproteobacteria bacterium]
MYEFNYHRPKSLDEAASAAKEAEDGKILAGGMTLIPSMKLRLAAPSDLVDLADVEGLKGITVGSGTVTIGAMTRHHDVQSSADVQKAIPALAQLAGGIGDPSVRHRGTMGGSVANSDPAADYPAAVLGLDATVKTNSREIAADDFFLGLFETALEEGEIITAIEFKIPDAAAYMKFAQPASGFAMVGAFVAKFGGDVRVAITGAKDCVFRVTEMEDALKSNFSADAIADIMIGEDDLLSDIHCAADYRAHLVTVMAKRAVAQAAG